MLKSSNYLYHWAGKTLPVQEVSLLSTWKRCHGEGMILPLGVCWRGRTPCQEVGALLFVSIRKGSSQLSGTWGPGPDPGREKFSGCPRMELNTGHGPRRHLWTCGLVSELWGGLWLGGLESPRFRKRRPSLDFAHWCHVPGGTATCPLWVALLSLPLLCPTSVVCRWPAD